MKTLMYWCIIIVLCSGCSIQKMRYSRGFNIHFGVGNTSGDVNPSPPKKTLKKLQVIQEEDSIPEHLSARPVKDSTICYSTAGAENAIRQKLTKPFVKTLKQLEAQKIFKAENKTTATKSIILPDKFGKTLISIALIAAFLGLIFAAMTDIGLLFSILAFVASGIAFLCAVVGLVFLKPGNGSSVFEAVVAILFSLIGFGLNALFIISGIKY